MLFYRRPHSPAALCPWSPGHVVSTAPLSSGRPDSPLLGLEVQTPLVLGLSRIFPPEYHRAAANLLSPPPGAGAGAQPSLCLFCVWGGGGGPFPFLLWVP